VKLSIKQMIKLQALKTKLRKLITSPRAQMFALLAIFGSAMCFAQNAAGDYSAGTTALTTVTTEIAKYVPVVVKLCYAIAGVVAVVGAVSVYISMNNDEQDVKKKVMMVVGACIFLVAAAQALPLFFGL
jgi:type IV secretory pathway VirB2 component (pilin)